MKRAWSRVLVNCSVLVVLCIGADSKKSSGSEVPPLWIADLNQFSYASRPEPHYIGGRPYIGGKFIDIGVAITALDGVVCYFVTREGVGQLVQRERLDDPATSRKLNIIFFDPESGALKFRKQLPTRSGFSSVLINDKGNFILRAGDFLRLYGRDFVVLKERKLDATQQYIMDEWQMRLSASGMSLLLNHYSPSGTYDEILDSSSLGTISTLKVPGLRDFSISERVILHADRDHKKVFVRSSGGQWQTLVPQLPLSCVSNPVLIDDHRIVNACGREVVLLGLDSNLLMRDEVDKKENLEDLVSVTPDGRFFALSAMQTKGGFMDYTSIKRGRTRILVYDTTLRKRIFSVQVDPIPKKDYDFALAPDGGKLAVMIDSQLKVYAIQPQNKVPGSEGFDLKNGTLHRQPETVAP